MFHGVEVRRPMHPAAYNYTVRTALTRRTRMGQQGCALPFLREHGGRFVPFCPLFVRCPLFLYYQVVDAQTNENEGDHPEERVA